MAMNFWVFEHHAFFDHLGCLSRKHVDVFVFSDMDEIILGY
jgi:hypothetical protein